MNDSTILLRQINPNFIRDGRVTSQAFKPTPKDEDLLSVYDGDMISPQDSLHHFEDSLDCSSSGVMGVTVEECKEQDLTANSDPAPFPEHAVIDYSDLSNGQISKKAKKITKVAQERDWLYKK
ncbi:hypothetical protein [Halomonas elongata]|uniref:hypothetical protein n=1 Tax=Halomonas elongata TaxID=2746 RepID=UPI0023B0FECD|nr:hypothetical protein [Halomonas elongata]